VYEENQLASVALFRLHMFGGVRKLAKITYVVTKPRLRGQGLCALLMTNLEKRLRDVVGVHDLLLPSCSLTTVMWVHLGINFVQ
jgi:predicted GNAT family N-acyltransferase